MNNYCTNKTFIIQPSLGSDSYLSGTTLNGTTLYYNMSNAMSAFTTDFSDMVLDASSNYISNVELSGNTLNFTGNGKAFKGGVDLSSISDLSHFTPTSLNTDYGVIATVTELNYVDGVNSSIQSQLNGKQVKLVSGNNIKTINSTSLLGSGNISIPSGDKGDPFVYSDFTVPQLADLKGEQGDPFEYSDFTPTQLSNLKGAKGDKGDKGDDGADGVGDTYTAGSNININGSNVISATDTKYTAGTNITIVDNEISSTGTDTNPAGSDTQIQFNDNGSFGASNNLTWDGNALTIDGVIEIGTNASSTGDGATAIGVDSTAIGISSFALGQNSKTANSYSFALGRNSNTKQSHSFAIGYYAKAHNSGSYAIGYEAESTGVTAIAIGRDSKAPLGNTIAIGGSSNVGTYMQGKVIHDNIIRLKAYTVATLPTGSEGDMCYVTDANAPTYLGSLTGGGSIKCPVFYNGTEWVSH